MCKPQTGLQSQWNVNTSVLTERVCFPLEAFRIHLWFLIKLVTELITCYAWFRFNYHFLHKNVSVFIFSRRAKSDYNKMIKIGGYKLDLMLYFQDISENIIIILNMHWFIELWGEYPIKIQENSTLLWLWIKGFIWAVVYMFLSSKKNV